jgi:queuine tRNA-ribosyltransferase
MQFESVHTDRVAGDRAGILKTSHAAVSIETPAFMPCGTIGAVKAVRWSELENLGYRLVLMNALHLYLRPGKDIISQFGGVHSFSTWQGAVLTDSGGYQFFSLKGLYSIDDDGVEFRSPYDGSSHHFTPESVIDLQVALGSDIAMPLDHCPPGNAPRDEIVKASNRTLKWLKQAVARFGEIGSSSQAIFGIIQGGTDLDLRRDYLDQTVQMNLDGYALGGISVGEDRTLGDRVVSEMAGLLPADKPRYLMGVGLPGQILDGIASGIDLFDCVLPTRMARNGTHQIPERRGKFTSDRGYPFADGGVGGLDSG